MLDMTVLVNPGAAHQRRTGDAVAAGVAVWGGKARVVQGDHAQTQHVAVWGWRRGSVLRARGHDVLVMERAYLGDRYEWVSLAWNGLNRRGVFHYPDPATPESRLNAHFPGLLRPWRSDGKYALLLGQVPGDMSLYGLQINAWLRQTAELMRLKYDLPVWFRPHPLVRERGHSEPVFQKPVISRRGATLEEDLSGAAVAVAYSSNAAVDAVLAGVPTVVTHDGAMAHPVAGHRIGDRVTPDRSQWAARLAWSQWLPEEIAAGEAFRGFRA